MPSQSSTSSPSRAAYVREYQRQRRADPIWQARYAASKRAGRMVAAAIKSGALTRPDQCSRCSESGFIEASHIDYTRPLDVVWLCRPCHRAEDKRTPKTLR